MKILRYGENRVSCLCNWLLQVEKVCSIKFKFHQENQICHSSKWLSMISFFFIWWDRHNNLIEICHIEKPYTTIHQTKMNFLWQLSHYDSFSKIFVKITIVLYYSVGLKLFQSDWIISITQAVMYWKWFCYFYFKYSWERLYFDEEINELNRRYSECFKLFCHFIAEFLYIDLILFGFV